MQTLCICVVYILSGRCCKLLIPRKSHGLNLKSLNISNCCCMQYSPVSLKQTSEILKYASSFNMIFYWFFNCFCTGQQYSWGGKGKNNNNSRHSQGITLSSVLHTCNPSMASLRMEGVNLEACLKEKLLQSIIRMKPFIWSSWSSIRTSKDKRIARKISMKEFLGMGEKRKIIFHKLEASKRTNKQKNPLAFVALDKCSSFSTSRNCEKVMTLLLWTWAKLFLEFLLIITYNRHC